MLTLSACSGGDTVVDGWWDNGDPVRVPAKSTLFDDNGVPLCKTPTAFGQVETRSRAFTTNGGVVNSFLFEVTNPETDPSTGATKAEQEKLAILQDSLGAMYQLTFPSFDKANGISSAQDMRKVKDDLQKHLPNIFQDSKQITDYIAVDQQWIEGPQGHFTVRRLSDPEGYIKDNKIDTTFNGLANQYFVATSDSGDEFLLERNKETGASRLLSAGAEPVVLDSLLRSSKNSSPESLVATKYWLASPLKVVSDRKSVV